MDPALGGKASGQLKYRVNKDVYTVTVEQFNLGMIVSMSLTASLRLHSTTS